LTGVDTRLSLSSEIEITLEANPGTVDQSRFAELKSAGINRLSLGVQSFQEDKLKLLGRIHDGKAAKDAVAYAQKCGFNNVNIDLMFGLPTQTIADALFDLETALSFETTHLSWYQLTIEPNTVFYRYPPTLPNDGLLWDMQTAGQALLYDRQLLQYEVSAYAKKNFPCQHNLNYWQFGDYLGIGAGAHSKITTERRVSRHAQVKQPKDYLDPKKNKTANKFVLSEQDLLFEFMLNALRLTDGVSQQLFIERTGLPISKIASIIDEAVGKKLLRMNGDIIQPTELGKRFLNDLVGMFLV
jgi:oxygen-independent coproporphyrinogen-3 oxidase